MTQQRPHSGPVRRRLARAAALAALVAVVPVGGSASAQDAPTTRLVGESNVQAAIAWSQATYADGTAPTALLARDDDFADSLASGGAQSALEAPLLLTNPAAPSPETLAELDRLGTETVIVLGGEAAVGPAVVTALEASGHTVERVGGANRLATAVAVAQRFYPRATSVVLARAFASDEDPTQAFADSVAVNAYVNGSGIPVLLTDTAALSAETADYLAASPIEEVIVAGGTAAIADPVLTQVEATSVAATGPEGDRIARRIAGNTRFATAVAFAMDFGYATAAEAPRVVLVEGQGADAWASGLPAGTQAGNGAAMVLASGDQLLPETVEFLTGGNVPLICGPKTSQAACDAAEAALRA